MDNNHQNPKIGGWLYGIALYFAYRIIVTAVGIIFAYQYLSNFSYYLIDTFFTASIFFLTIMLIWSIIAFCKKYRAFPYVLGSLLIYQICSNGISIWNMMNEMTAYGEFVSPPTFFKLLFHTGIASIIGLYLLLSKRVKETFIK